ncbi:MAG: succinyl-diaminopimelate desuccinylase [Thermoleophilaceae bacterium]|jgi:succinyl-diaminopimelate desuccinylase|nr:succinyl-diaminopimelate desuccinylase [Thermoleophilaceae bacterium]
MDECALTRRLMAWDTSHPEGIRSCAGFIKGWLEARDIEVRDAVFNGRPVLAATVGADSGPTLVLHGHLDVVPAHAEQFEPVIDGDRLIGRGAYDMKGGLAGMMVAASEVAGRTDVRVHFVCVADEESDETELRASDWLVKQGYVGDFAITGEPTDLHIGVQAKGVLALRLIFAGRAAHGSTPWQGDNAVLKALHGFRRIEQMEWGQESSELFPRPSVNLGRIMGGDALNKVPDRCVIDIDIRYLPGQDPAAIQQEIAGLPGVEVRKVFHRAPILVEASNPHVQLLAQAIEEGTPAERISVGRDGTSDAISFLEAGVPAVEFGPTGAGHHGPEEWVSISSLQRYRQALVNFVDLAAGGTETTRLRIA